MGAFASLSSTSIVVEPGGETTCELKIRNTGTVVDQFTIQVIGEDMTEEESAWMEAEPSILSLFPDTEGVSLIRFKPPRSASVQAGTIGFAVKISSITDPEATIVEEGVLEIGRFTEVEAELTPRMRTIRRQGRFRLAVDNFGNMPVHAALDLEDANQSLKFRFTPALTAGAGTRTSTGMQVRPRKLMWRGAPKLHPFKAILEPEGAPQVAADGQVIQQALIPTWLIMALLALIALAILWAVLLRPAIETAARVGATDEAKAAAAEAAAAADDAAGAAAAASDAEKKAAASEKKTDKTAAGLALGTGTPVDGRLFIDTADPGSGGGLGDEALASFTVPNERTLSLTDLVLQNPSGDTGVMTVERLVENDDGTSTRTTLLRFALENFRDIDFHYVTPIIFKSGEELLISVSCRAGGGSNAGGTPKPCRNQSILFTGASIKEKTE